MVEYRYATAADVRDFYGKIPFTLRAVAILVDGACLGLITLLHYRGKAWLCADHKPDLDVKRFAILRATKLAMTMVQGPVYALADNKPLLERLGFVPYEGDIYRKGA